MPLALRPPHVYFAGSVCQPRRETPASPRGAQHWPPLLGGHHHPHACNLRRPRTQCIVPVQPSTPVADMPGPWQPQLSPALSPEQQQSGRLKRRTDDNLLMHRRAAS